MSAEERGAGVGRRSLSSVLGVCAAVAAVLLAVTIVAGGLAIESLSRHRTELVEGVDPALLTAVGLRAALLDQETGVRGYTLGVAPAFLEPYARGRAQEDELVARLRGLSTSDPAALRDVDEVESRARAWRTTFADPTLAAVAARAPAPGPEVGRAGFDAVRGALGTQRDHLYAMRESAIDAVNSAAHTLRWVGILIVVVLAAGLAAVLLWLRRVAVVPTQRLAGEVRLVVEGALERPVAVRGPKEIAGLGADVDAMRRTMLAELADTESARRELERSNSDLEQFAYVASHDLQEPLRKVASFCQLLQRRYGGQLDERADQYIEFAVDGAKRMQLLINDLLAFSRVGRSAGEFAEVDTGALLDRAGENVAGTLEESGGEITHGELPPVSGEPVLLTTVFQNLLGNSLKFRGDDPPRIHVDAVRDGDRWLLRFCDNGIGIEAEYADRIFVIFQRLHGRGTYEGTGIGLAMCRKIVEHHGGSMWLEPTDAPGSMFVVALPVLPADATDSPVPATESPVTAPGNEVTRV